MVIACLTALGSSPRERGFARRIVMKVGGIRFIPA